MKKLVIGGVINAVISLAVGGGATWAVMHYMHPGAIPARTTAAESEETEMKDSVFISMPETIITLHDKDEKDRYMLIEIVMVADGKDKEKTDMITANQPLYQSIAVDTLSSMSYEDLRKLHISDIRDLLLTKINQGITSRKMKKPYDDILIKKIVYQ